MCGIVGAAGHFHSTHKDLFTSLLELNVVRGRHSTGVATATYTGDTNVYKRAVPAPEFISDKGFDQNIKTTNQCVWIGHGRHATVNLNSIDEDSAHPFQHGHITGVHNGTLDFGWRSNFQDSGPFQSDSDAIYHHMAKYGVEDAIARTDGAYALVWYNSDEHTLNFIRNDQRPFHWTVNDDRTCLYWSSSANIFASAVEHTRGARTDKSLIKNLELLPVDQWYKFALPSVYNEKLTKPVVKPLKGGTNVTPSYGTYSYGKGWTSGASKRFERSSTTSTVGSRTKEETVLAKSPNGQEQPYDFVNKNKVKESQDFLKWKEGRLQDGNYINWLYENMITNDFEGVAALGKIEEIRDELVDLHWRNISATVHRRNISNLIDLIRQKDLLAMYADELGIDYTKVDWPDAVDKKEEKEDNSGDASTFFQNLTISEFHNKYTDSTCLNCQAPHDDSWDPNTCTYIADMREEDPENIICPDCANDPTIQALTPYSTEV